jgi:hypothetical protein
VSDRRRADERLTQLATAEPAAMVEARTRERRSRRAAALRALDAAGADVDPLPDDYDP